MWWGVEGRNEPGRRNKMLARKRSVVWWAHFLRWARSVSLEDLWYGCHTSKDEVEVWEARSVELGGLVVWSPPQTPPPPTGWLRNFSQAGQLITRHLSNGKKSNLFVHNGQNSQNGHNYEKFPASAATSLCASRIQGNQTLARWTSPSTSSRPSSPSPMSWPSFIIVVIAIFIIIKILHFKRVQFNKVQWSLL